MNLFDKIKANAEDRRVKECTIFGERVLVKLHSLNQMTQIDKELGDGDDRQNAELIAKQFLDPKTKDPVLTADWLMDECTQADALQLVRLFIKMNRVNDDSLEQAEKN